MTGADELRSAGRLADDVPLGRLTTYKFGGRARYLVTADDADDVRAAFGLARREQVPVAALGRGSNVVVSDRGFDGVVIVAGPGLARRSVEGDVVLAGCGVPLPLLARESVRAGRGGLEFYTGIPGSVGGAIRMNAGCHGSETSDVLVTASVYDSLADAVSDRTPVELGLRYRHSDLTDHHYVLGAVYRTSPQSSEIGERTLREITRWRREHQPGGTHNAGSVFKNPPGDAAGRIIDEAGLKGFSVGAATVSERHANFFVAGDDASAMDVRSLVDEVRRIVRERSGVELVPEIRFLGDFE